MCCLLFLLVYHVTYAPERLRAIEDIRTTQRNGLVVTCVHVIHFLSRNRIYLLQLACCCWVTNKNRTLPGKAPYACAYNVAMYAHTVYMVYV
jgi:hypothetical protein